MPGRRKASWPSPNWSWWQCKWGRPFGRRRCRRVLIAGTGNVDDTNTLKTALLLGLLSGLCLVIGEALGGQQGLYMALAFAGVMNFASYFFSDKIALAMYSAQRVTETENPEVYRRVEPIVRNLCQRMGLPMPKLWLIPEDSPNAFATGRNPSHASVAFTTGILQLMSDTEIEGVVAHELGHVLHRDILISSVAATVAAAITMLARMAFWFGGRATDDDREGGGMWARIVHDDPGAHRRQC